MYEAQAWRLVRRLARNAGIKSAGQLSPHCLRHTFATSLDHAGVALQDIQDAMGHADPRTTRRYMAGGCSLDAAQEVTKASLDALAALVGGSLVEAPSRPRRGSRLTMLEPVRQYAGERLSASGEGDRLSRAHLGYFARLADEAALGLEGAAQVHWGRCVDGDAANFRRAMGYAREIDDADSLLRIAI